MSNGRASTSSLPLLDVERLEGWYGESKVLHGITLNVQQGEVVTLLGRNGAGKSTTLKAIIGLLEKRSGSVQLAGTQLVNLPPRRIAAQGVAFCPEERGIFTKLTVRENLVLPRVVGNDGLNLEQIYSMFPNLGERQRSFGGRLSGGEQQMLAIARILRVGAKLLLLDEPSEGLAPVIIDQILKTVKKLKSMGLTLLLVEQNLRFTNAVSDRNYVIENGSVVDMIRSEDMSNSSGKLKRYLGV